MYVYVCVHIYIHIYVHVYTYRCRSLRAVDLSRNLLSGRGIQDFVDSVLLREGMQIGRLSLSKNRIDGAALRGMLAALGNNQLPSLTALELAHCSLSDDVGEDMREMLAGNTSLTALSLSWNKLRVGGLVEVAEGVCASASLASVDLSWNGFGDMAPLGVLCDALHSRNTTLTWLDLGHNRVTGQGCTVLAQALQANTSLTKLVLDGNPVGAAGAKQLVTLTLPDDDEVEGEAADLYGCGAGGAMEGEDTEAEGSLLGLVWQADDLEVGGMGPDRQPVVPVCMWVYVHLSIDLSIYLSVCLSIYLSIYLSIDLSIYPSIYLSIYVHLHTYTCVYVSRAWGRTGSPRERGSSTRTSERRWSTAAPRPAASRPLRRLPFPWRSGPSLACQRASRSITMSSLDRLSSGRSHRRPSSTGRRRGGGRGGGGRERCRGEGSDGKATQGREAGA